MHPNNKKRRPPTACRKPSCNQLASQTRSPKSGLIILAKTEDFTGFGIDLPYGHGSVHFSGGDLHGFLLIDDLHEKKPLRRSV